MSILTSVDWPGALDHYKQREVVHERLLRLHDGAHVDAFAALLLGVSDPIANYSAVQHGLGPKILSANVNAAQRVFDLATQLRQLNSAHQVPKTIRAAGISYLQVGVGSEVSCMMNPTVCWIANTRTIWTHLVIKHADNIATANEALAAYRDAEASSEMAYRIWAAIHAELATSMTRVAEEGARLARLTGVEPGPLTYIWGDVVADALYVQHHR